MPLSESCQSGTLREKSSLSSSLILRYSVIPHVIPVNKNQLLFSQMVPVVYPLPWIQMGSFGDFWSDSRTTFKWDLHYYLQWLYFELWVELMRDLKIARDLQERLKWIWVIHSWDLLSGFFPPESMVHNFNKVINHTSLNIPWVALNVLGCCSWTEGDYVFLQF